MNKLRQYIKNCVAAGGRYSVGNSMSAHINRAVKRAMLGWSKASFLSPPTTLQEVINWEVNDYLSKLSSTSTKDVIGSDTATEEATARGIKNRALTQLEIMRGNTVGNLTVKCLSPNIGILPTGKSVAFTYTEQVSIGRVYAYWYSKGRYVVKGDKGVGVEKPYGIPLGFRVFLQQTGDKISSIWPDANVRGVEGNSVEVLRGVNTLEKIYSETSYATIEGVNYIEYRKAEGTDPLACQVVLNVSLAAYFVNSGRWVHTSPGKIVLYKDYALVSVIRCYDKSFILEPNLPLEGSRTYSQHNVHSNIHYDLLVINRITGAVRPYVRPTNPAPVFQVTHYGYIDFFVNAVTRQLVIAEVLAPFTANLTVQAMQVRLDKDYFSPSLGADIAIKSRTELLTALGTHGAFDTHLEPIEGNTKIFPIKNTAIRVAVYEIDDTGLQIKQQLFYQEGLISSMYGHAVVGGYTHAVLGQDNYSGEMFLMRGYEAYLQTPFETTELLEHAINDFGQYQLSQLYKTGIYPGDVVMFGGNKIYDFTGLELANIPGEAATTFSTLKDDAVGDKAINGTLVNSSIVKKFLNVPRFAITDTVTMLRERDLTSVFHGGSNVGTIFTTATGELRYLNSVGISLDKLRLIVLRDLTQPQGKQTRFVVQGIRSQVDINALDAHIVATQGTSTQGAILIIPAQYSTFPVLHGYGYYAFGHYLPTYDTQIISQDNLAAWHYIVRMWLLKMDFIQPASNQVYFYVSGEVQIGWYNTTTPSQAKGDTLAFNYGECYKLEGLKLKGWAQDMIMSTTGRKDISLVEIGG